MPKLALCILADDAPMTVQKIRNAKTRGLLTDKETIDAVLALTHLSMQDRATCETDPTFLQLIPYVIVTNNVQDHVFNYSRGAGSAEERLVAKLSVGLGGHVDSHPPENTSLEQHLRAEAARELREEVGITVVPEHLKITGILVDATTPVDIVHLGILCTYVADPDEVFGAEANVIEKGHFNSLADLRKPEVFDRMENWSKLAVRTDIEELVETAENRDSW